MTQTLTLFFTLFFMMIGLIFTVIPPIPGTLIIWGAALGYGLILGWQELGWLTFGLMTVLMVVGVVADFVGGQFGAKFGGASCLAIVLGTILGLLLGLVGSLIGTPLLGCVAGLGGTLGGILLVERTRHGNWENAVTATKGYVAGTTLGIAARVTAGVMMMVVFMVRVYLGN